MGGKDSVIADRDADLSAALEEEMVVSALSYQGQRCSAGSHAIIEDFIHDNFVAQLVSRTRKLQVGDPTDPRTDIGPVMNQNTFQRILEFIEVGKTDGKLLIDGGPVGGERYFIQPTIFGNVHPKATIAQKEILGPAVVCIRARTPTKRL